LKDVKLHADNIGLITDIICCPGMDFCALATARSIPVSQAIAQRFSDPVRQRAIGEMQIKISGCINACGHHHVGHIGILGVDKKGEEWYQLTLGGSASDDAELGGRLGPAIAKEDVAGAISDIMQTYVSRRDGDERLIDTYRRVGVEPFKESVYGGNA